MEIHHVLYFLHPHEDPVHLFYQKPIPQVSLYKAFAFLNFFHMTAKDDEMKWCIHETYPPDASEFYFFARKDIYSLFDTEPWFHYRNPNYSPLALEMRDDSIQDTNVPSVLKLSHTP